MTVQWTTTDRFTAANGCKIQCYGPSGAGKTRLIATAPRPIIATSEKKLMSLRRESIPTAVIETLQDFDEVTKWVAMSNEAKAFDTFCLDSASDIAETILSNLKSKTRDPRQAYGELIDEIERRFRWLRDLPQKHVYMICKEEPIKDATGVTRFGPMFPGGKLGNNSPYFFDFVLRLGSARTQDGRDYSFLQCKRDLMYDAKDSSGVLDPMEPPDLSHVINKILGGAART